MAPTPEEQDHFTAQDRALLRRMAFVTALTLVVAIWTLVFAFFAWLRTTH